MEFALCKLASMQITPTKLSEAAEISVPFASQILADPPTRRPSCALAYRIYDRTGLKLGHIANLNDEQVAALRALDEAA